MDSLLLKRNLELKPTVPDKDFRFCLRRINTAYNETTRKEFIMDTNNESNVVMSQMIAAKKVACPEICLSLLINLRDGWLQSGMQSIMAHDIVTLNIVILNLELMIENNSK
jgi:hypothetical protein